MSLKKIFVIFAIALILLMPLKIQATEESFIIVKYNDDYIIYIKGFEEKEFVFAFNNNPEVNPSELTYINNWTDSNGINVACLDNGFGVDLTQNVYLWIKDISDNEILSKAELNLENSVELTKLSELNTLTKRIEVDLTQKDNIEEIKDGIKITKELGKLIIKNSDKSIFKYDIYKLSNSKDATKLVDLLEESEKISDKEMIEKIEILKETEDSFNTLIANANWKIISENEVKQPEDTANGDRYLVLLQEIDENQNIKTDLQILECNYKENETVTAEKIPMRSVSILPVTGEEIGVYVFLATIVVLIAIVVIRILFLNRKNKNENE